MVALRLAGAVLTVGVAWFWAGLVTGLSLLAAPAKFTVEALPESLALQVGQAQFGLLYLGEVILAVLLVAALVLWRPPRAVLVVAGLVLLLYLVQRLGILPPLTARTTQRILGEPVTESALHVWYIAIDVAKVALLAVLGVLATLRLARSGERS